MDKITKFIIVVWLAIVVSGGFELMAQKDDWRDAFPQATNREHLEKIIYLWPVFAKLNFDDSQRQMAFEIQQADHWAPGTKEMRQALYDSLSHEQLESLELIAAVRLVEQRIENETRKNFGQTEGLESVNSLLTQSAFIDWLALTKEQVEAIEFEYQSLVDQVKQYDNELQSSLEGAFNNWQSDLLDQLLIFQRSNYESALGEGFIFPKKVEKFFNSRGVQPIRMDFWKRNATPTGMMLGSPNPIDMIHEMPFFLDSPFQPHVLFELISLDEFQSELKLKTGQIQSLNRAKEVWYKENPLPDSIEVSHIKFGRNRSSKQQREEAFAAEEKLSNIMTEVKEVLADDQYQRLRQIWNQMLLEIAWVQVPLAFPDWRDYLELSLQQREMFDEVNNRYIQKIEQLHQDRLKKRGQSASDFNSATIKILTEEQKEKTRKLIKSQR